MRQPERRSSYWAWLQGALTLSRGGTGATLLSFVAALVHFTIEVLVYKTMSLKSAANPLVIAGALLVLYTLHAEYLHAVADRIKYFY